MNKKNTKAKKLGDIDRTWKICSDIVKSNLKLHIQVRDYKISKWLVNPEIDEALKARLDIYLKNFNLMTENDFTGLYYKVIGFIEGWYLSFPFHQHRG